MLLLTDKEIHFAEHEALLCFLAGEIPMHPINYQYKRARMLREAVAKAQAKKAVAYIKNKSWLSFNSHHDKIRVMWNDDFEALLKEVENGTN